MRRAARTDSPHKAIVAALRAIGVYVLDCSRLGNGAPDLFCYHAKNHEWYAVEVKTAKGRLTPMQADLHDLANVYIVRSVSEALALFGVQG